MITGPLKSQVDAIWDAFWTGGISNPISVIEQITYLLFIRRLDENFTVQENKSNRLGTPIEDPTFTDETMHLRWSRFKDIETKTMYELVRDQVFPFIKTLGNGNGNEDRKNSFAHFMEDAIFMIPKPSLLEQVVEMVSQLDLTDKDAKGDLYEYLLSKLTTAGVNGQFRTPRHIIQMMVQMREPEKTDKICDPACGTAGFLMAAQQYVWENHMDIFQSEEGKAHYHNEMFNGFDFDSHMLRMSAMNLMLHGIDNPNVKYQDSLGEHEGMDQEFDLILANPPFKGSVAYDEISPDLIRALGKTPKKDTGKGKKPTEKTELLFIALILRMLKLGGRAAVIVPDGVLFGNSKAHQEVRKSLVEGHKLEAVISMPGGVFKPYAGVSTGILFFTRTDSGGTEDVWFYDMQADGFSLDDKRAPLDEAKEGSSDLPDIQQRWKALEKEKTNPRTAKSFMVPKAELVENGYDLSVNRYKDVVYEEVNYDPPKEILGRLQGLNAEIEQGLKDLGGLLE